MSERQKKLLFWLLVAADVALVAFILRRSLKPAAASDAESGEFLSLFGIIFPQITMHTVRKMAHFAEFFVLGTLLSLTFAVRVRPMLTWPLLCGITVAAADETVQLFVEGRSGQIKDVALDSAGVLCAVLSVWLVSRLRRKRRENKSGG